MLKLTLAMTAAVWLPAVFLPPVLSAQSGLCVWTVNETENGSPHQWTWTSRGGSPDFDAIRVHTQTGQKVRFTLRMTESNPNRTFVFVIQGKPGAFRGTYTLDGRKAEGFKDWGTGRFTAEISGCGLGQPADRTPDEVFAAARQQGLCAWRVHEPAGGVVLEWAWIQRGNSNEYDGTRLNPSTGELVSIPVRLIDRRPNREVAFERLGFPGVYRGSYSADGGSAQGGTDWGGAWQAEISGCGLGVVPSAPTGPGKQWPPVLVSGLRPGTAWKVVETMPNERWEAVWTVKPDGRSLSASWRHVPGDQTGQIETVGVIESVQGNRIVIGRPGLGVYTGTIDPGSGTITGKTSWSPADWVVTLPGGGVASSGGPAGSTKPTSPSKPVPAPKKPQIFTDSEEDMSPIPVFRHLAFGPFGIRAETSWKDDKADRQLTLTWQGDLLKGVGGAKIRFTDQGSAYRTPAERDRLVKTWKATPAPPTGLMAVAGGKLGEVAAECIRRDPPRSKAAAFECLANDGAMLYKVHVDAPGTYKEWPPGVLTVLNTLRWLNPAGKRNRPPLGPHPIEKAIAKLPPLPDASKDVLWSAVRPGMAPADGGAEDLGYAPRRTQKSSTAAQYEAAANSVMAAFRELSGEMEAEQSQRFERKWSAFLENPSTAAMSYLDAILPITEELIATRETMSNAAEAFDRAWLDAVAAATIDDEAGANTALLMASQQVDVLRAGMTRLNRLRADAERLGNPPDLPAARQREKETGGGLRSAPVADSSPSQPMPPTGTLTGLWLGERAIHGFFPLRDGTFGEVDCDAPELGCFVYNWRLKRLPSGEYVPDTLRATGGSDPVAKFRIAVQGDTMRWLRDANTREPYGSETFRLADPSREPPMAFSPVQIEAARKLEAERQKLAVQPPATPAEERLLCVPYNSACMIGHNNTRKYTAMAVAQLSLRSPGDLNEARQIAKLLTGGSGSPGPSPSPGGGSSGSMLIPPRSPQEIREAIAEHKVWLAAIEKSLERDRTDLAKAKKAAEQDLLLWRIVNAEANIQAERDLIQSLETGSYVHTRTGLDDVLHAQMIARSVRYNSRVDQTRHYAEGLLRLANNAATPEDAAQIRAFAARQLTGADIAAGNLEKAKQAARAVEKMVQGSNEGDRARAAESEADMMLRFAERTKTAASVALALLAPAAMAELGLSAAAAKLAAAGVGVGYGGATGYVEGGPAEGIRQAVSQSCLAGAVAIEAMDGYKAGGAWGAVERGGITFLTGKFLEYGASKAGPAYARLRGAKVPQQPLPKMTIDEWRTHVQVLNERENAENLILLFRRASGEQRERLAAEINSNYMAKLVLKLSGAKGPGRTVEADVRSAISLLYHNRVDPAFRNAVAQRKLRWQERGPDGKWRDAGPLEFEEIRQASKRQTINMDRDFKVNERDPSRFRIAEGDQAVSLHDAQEKLQEIYEQSYRATMFGQDPRRAFQNITTTKSGEAYRQTAFTRLTKPIEQQPNIWRDPWAGQAADVARDKVQSLDRAPMSQILIQMEKARTTAKEIEQRLISQLTRGKANPATIAYWRQVQASLNVMQTDPVAGQKMLRITAGEESIHAVMDRVATAIEAANKLGR